MTIIDYILYCLIAIVFLLIGFYIGSLHKGTDCGVLQVISDADDGSTYLYLNALRDPSEMAKLDRVSFQVRNVFEDRRVRDEN